VPVEPIKGRTPGGRELALCHACATVREKTWRIRRRPIAPP
jgi:hypothetical protein